MRMGRCKSYYLSVHWATALSLVLLTVAVCFCSQTNATLNIDGAEFKTDVEQENVNHLDGVVPSPLILTSLWPSSAMGEILFHHAPLLMQWRGSNRAPPASMFRQV